MTKNLINIVPTLSANIRHADGSEDGRRPSKDMHPRPRWGKTDKDRRSHAHQRNEENKQSRALWQQDPKATANNFPYASCNGKRNRTMITRTRKGNLVIKYKVKD